MANSSGATKLTLSLDAVKEPPGAKFLSAVQRAVASDYQVLGELGRGANGKIFFLAREHASGSLVALQLVLGDNYQQSGELWLDVLRKLDASLPTGESACPRCGAQLRGFKRFCGTCGADLSGVAPGSGANSSDAELMQAVKQAAGRDYEVLGQMDRAEGGGIVYFARELKTNKIVALRLERDASTSEAQPRFNLGRTMVLDRVVESLGGPKEPEQKAQPLVSLSDTKKQPDPSPPPRPDPRRPTPPPKPINWTVIGVGGFTLVAALVALRLVFGGGKSPDAVGPVKRDSLPLVPPVQPAELRVAGQLPPGTTISIDDHQIEGMSAKVAPGAHTMVAAASGFRSASQSFDVAAGQTLVWSPTLAPAIKAKPVVPRVTPPVKVIPKGEADGGPRPETAVRPPRLGVPTVTCGTLFAALDWARALTLCTKEASDGGTTAQRALGTMYERGLGTETNEATAAGWYTKAADGGDHLAQVRLGSLLRDGRGVNRDEKTAITWFQKAAEQGDADGQWALGDMLERGKGVKKNRTEAAGWYQKAAEQGHPAAQYNLGVLLAKGDGVPKNEAEAVTWFTKSAAQGNTKAADELRKRGRS